MIDPSKTVLVDVDGVVLDLFGAAIEWWEGNGGKKVDADRPLVHDDLGEPYWTALSTFMALDDCYSIVKPLPGTLDGLTRLTERGYLIAFCTSVFGNTYDSKLKRLKDLIGDRFPFLFLSVPSAAKHLVQAALAIDDRADICLRYVKSGTPALLIARRWSFGGCPETTTATDTFGAMRRTMIFGAFSWDASEEPILNDDRISGGMEFSFTQSDKGSNAWDNIDMIVNELEKRRHGD